MLRSLLINTGSNLLVLFVKITITFIMTPILVHNLGNYDYGLWEMVFAIIGYMGMLDLGLKPAIGRFSSKLKADNDHDGLLEVYNTALVYMFLIGLLLLVVFTSWGLWFPDLIAPNDSASTERYTALLLILGVQLLVIFPGYVAESFLEGFQLYYVKNIITIINSITGSSIIYFLITPDNALLLLVSINTIGLSIKYLLFYILLLRPNYGSMKFNIKKFSFIRLKEILTFGGKSFIQGVSTRIEQATDSLLIGMLLGPAIVPFYSIPANLVRYISTIGMNLTHAFMPLFSDLHTRQQHKQITKIYLSASKMVVGIIAPLAGGVIVIGAPFLGIWIGDEYRENADNIILLLVIFISFPFLNPFYSRYLTGINKHSILAKLSPISAIINLSLSIWFVHKYGIIGAALGSIIPVFIFTLIYFKRVCYHLDISVFGYMKNCIFPSLLPVTMMVSLLILFRIRYGIVSYLDLSLAVLLGSSIYCISFWLISLSKDEKNFIKQRLPFLRE